jgi:hypothetical protein
MAYLRISDRGKHRYYYIVRAVRLSDNRIRQKVLEYLGRDPDPARLRRACEYWGVKANSRAGGRKRA